MTCVAPYRSLLMLFVVSGHAIAPKLKGSTRGRNQSRNRCLITRRRRTQSAAAALRLAGRFDNEWSSCPNTFLTFIVSQAYAPENAKSTSCPAHVPPLPSSPPPCHQVWDVHNPLTTTQSIQGTASVQHANLVHNNRSVDVN